MSLRIGSIFTGVGGFLRALDRAARRGALTQRLRVRTGVTVSVVYVIPRPEARAS